MGSASTQVWRAVIMPVSIVMNKTQDCNAAPGLQTRGRGGGKLKQGLATAAQNYRRGNLKGFCAPDKLEESGGGYIKISEW